MTAIALCIWLAAQSASRTAAIQQGSSNTWSARQQGTAVRHQGSAVSIQQVHGS